jgi:hypothetical protein
MPARELYAKYVCQGVIESDMKPTKQAHSKHDVIMGGSEEMRLQLYIQSCCMPLDVKYAWTIETGPHLLACDHSLTLALPERTWLAMVGCGEESTFCAW